MSTKNEDSEPISIKKPEDLSYWRQEGAIGGRTRAKNLTPEKRVEIANKAIAARWAKRVVNND